MKINLLKVRRVEGAETAKKMESSDESRLSEAASGKNPPLPTPDTQISLYMEYKKCGLHFLLELSV
jgi:hypothetical protein